MIITKIPVEIPLSTNSFLDNDKILDIVLYDLLELSSPISYNTSHKNNTYNDNFIKNFIKYFNIYNDKLSNNNNNNNKKIKTIFEEKKKEKKNEEKKGGTKKVEIIENIKDELTNSIKKCKKIKKLRNNKKNVYLCSTANMSYYEKSIAILNDYKLIFIFIIFILVYIFFHFAENYKVT